MQVRACNCLLASRRAQTVRKAIPAAQQERGWQIDGHVHDYSDTDGSMVRAQQMNRRNLMQTALFGSLLGGAANSLLPGTSSAALLQFPTAQLKNNYYLVRAGEGQSEADGRVFTNPVYKTSMYSGLTPGARRQVVTQLVPNLRALGACQEGCYLWPSINQRSYQTAEIVADQLGLGRSRIVPEYSFLDARGLGDLEGMKAEAAAERVAEGDSASPDWRPPRGSDGTPHESVADVLVRGRQVLSICETQYRGADILIVSPDSDNLSILQAALLGVDLRQHSRFSFQPGEARPAQLSSEPVTFGNSKFACPNPPRCTN